MKRARSRRARRWGALLVTSLVSLATPVRPASADVGTVAPAAAASTKEQAFAHFDTGLALYDKGAWAAALAEFLEARRLYPLRNAVYQAGLCLQKLERYDEALEQFEAALREFGAVMPARVKENVQRKVVEMRGLVGEIAVDAAEPGATVTVDGLARGEYPLLAPLRVAAGSHLLRVSRTGFAPFEARVLVAGGKTERVAAHLAPLGPSGRIRIAEQAGRALEVLVDGTRVGSAPWDGPLEVGPHMVALRGDGNVGTPPVQVVVETDRTTSLTLTAEELSAALRVEPAPVNASVAIDGVNVGRGVWEGRLRQGPHRVEVSADGFLPAVDEIALGRDERLRRRVELRRDPRSTFAPRPSRFMLEAVTAPAFAPLFGGDVAGGCTVGCDKGTAAGGYGVVRGGYELGVGLGFGVAAGYLAAAQSVRNRSTSITAVGQAAEPVTVADSLWIHAGLVGAWAGFSLDVPVPLHLRLGAGALLGSASDTRAGGSSAGSVEPTGELRPLRGAYVAPEIRVSLVVRSRVEVSAGIEVLAVFVPSPPQWGGGHDVIVDRRPGLLEYATFPAETFAGPILAIAPSLGARYAF